MENSQSTRGKGSFWISRQAIQTFLENKSSAMEVCSYLVLARHSDESGQFSTSGMQAVYRAIGVGHDVAERAINKISNLYLGKARKVGNGLIKNLVYKSDDWEKITGLPLPHGPTELSKVRWVINDFGLGPEDRVWISNELVDGIGKFSQPLKRLKRCGDVAARLLLVCYEQTNLEQFGGARPSGSFAQVFTTTRQTNEYGFDLLHGKQQNQTVWGAARFIGNPLSKDESTKEKQLEQIWSAIKALDSNGFIYQVVSVMDAEAGNNDAQVIYELDTKSKHGYKPVGEKGLGGETAKIANLLGCPVADANGRLYGTYAVVVPEGIHAHVVGIYRTRFRVSNQKNHGIKNAWARIYQGQKEAQEWIDELNVRLGILI